MRVDRLDIDHLEELLRSPGWALVQERYLATLRKTQLALETADLKDVPTVQGQIAGYRTFLDVPSILQREMSSKKKN